MARSRTAPVKVLVDEVPHGVGDDSSKVDGEVERAVQLRVVLELTRGQAPTDGGDVAIDGVVGDDALAVVADRVDDDAKAKVGGRGRVAPTLRGCRRRSWPTTSGAHPPRSRPGTERTSPGSSPRCG